VPLHYRSCKELLLLFGHRRDVIEYRLKVDLAADSVERQNACACLNSLLGALSKLIVMIEIKDYIKESDVLALQGTKQSVEASHPVPSGGDTNARIGAFLTHS